MALHEKGIRSRDVTAVPVAALPAPPLARQSRDDLLGWRLVALAARGSLSPSDRFVRSLRDLPALTSRRPLRGALVRCGCASAAVLGAGAPVPAASRLLARSQPRGAAASCRPVTRPGRALLDQGRPAAWVEPSVHRDLEAVSWRPDGSPPARGLAGVWPRPAWPSISTAAASLLRHSAAVCRAGSGDAGQRSFGASVSSAPRISPWTLRGSPHRLARSASCRVMTSLGRID